MLPTGRQVSLQARGYTATITEVGATLRELAYRGDRLVRGYASHEIMPVHSGAVLAPWPNRIADGRYTFAGAEHQLPVTEPERATALHGLVCWSSWEIVRRSAVDVELRHILWPRPGYPFHLDLTMDYRLDQEGLTATLVTTNVGDVEAPYGCSIHPYLVPGRGRAEDWRLQLPCSRYLDVDRERLLPTGERSVDGTAFDFRMARGLGDLQLDHAFTGIDFDAAGRAEAHLYDRSGRGVRLSWDRTCRWVQVHTADRPEPALNRTGLALEPMTCPPNAFVTGVDLVRLRPGGTHTATWTFAAL